MTTKIIASYDLESLPHERAPVERRGSRDGYGRRIPSDWKVQIEGVWRRVYVVVYSNLGTSYVEQKDEDGNVAWIVIHGVCTCKGK